MPTRNRLLMRRLLGAFLCLLLLCPQQAAFAAADGKAVASAALPTQQTYANSDTTANAEDCYYEIDPESGALLGRDPDTLHAAVLFDEGICQMALYAEALYLLRSDGMTLLRFDTRTGAAETMFSFGGVVARFAVSDAGIYYLTDHTVFCCDYDGANRRTVCSEEGLYRFWLTDDGELEYMTEQSTVYTLRLSDGVRTARANAISNLPANMRAHASYDWLMEKFPDGKYWNHCGGPNNPDGWTEEPCTHHGYQGSGCSLYPNGCNCNSFCDTIQCFGFAYKLCYDYYGSTPDDWNNRLWWRPTDGIKAGDVFRFKNNRHTIWITGVDGDTVTYADCNYDGTCIIRWDQTISVSTLASTATYRDIAPEQLDTGIHLASPVLQAPLGTYYDDSIITVVWEPVVHAESYLVELRCDGALLRSEMQTQTELTLQPLAPGSYELSVTACDQSGRSKAAVLRFTVAHTLRDTVLRVWAGLYVQEDACETLLSGDGYWVNYCVYDSVTGQGFDAYCHEPYTVTLTVRGPDGTLLQSQTFSEPQGAFFQPFETPGDYTLQASLEATQTLESPLVLHCRAPGCADLGHQWSALKPDGPLPDAQEVPDATATPQEAVVFVCARCGEQRQFALPQTGCSGEEECPGAAYEDMPPSTNWAHTGLEFLLQNGIMNGVSQSSVAPALSMNRAMLVTLLWRMEGEPGARRLRYFTDVDANAYYARAVAWAAEQGIVLGVGNGLFAPTQFVTREQLATILYRYATRFADQTTAEALLASFPDAADASAYAREALGWAVQNDMIRGVSQQDTILLSPKTPATRAQVAAILLRLLCVPCLTQPADGP